MKITDYISRILNRDNHVLTYNRGGYVPDFTLTKYKFGETIYVDIVELLTSIYSEVTWTCANDTTKFKAWKAFVDRNGQRILTQLFTRKDGFVVIGYESSLKEDGSIEWTFYELPSKAYFIKATDIETTVECYDKLQQYFVLKSPKMEAIGQSERTLCDGAIKMADAVLNGSTTTAERLGAYVVMSPKQDNFGGTLDEKEKDQIEKELQREYGMLNKQKQIMVLPRPMDSAIVSLAAVDVKMREKLNAAVLIMADCVKVPANQIALIDANASKSLSNGTELREGDLSKYRAFRRLLNATLYDMAVELGMRVDYTIENEPKTVQGQNIEQ